MSTVVVVVLALVALLLWAVARKLTTRFRDRLPWYGVVGPRVLMATVASWAALQTLARWCELTGPWAIWLAAAIVGIGMEGTAALYQHEREAISPRLGRSLVALRCSVLLLLVLVLLQPVRVWTDNREISRRVVVVTDDSESMHFIDRQWSTSEMVDLAIQAELIKPEERLLPGLLSLADLPNELRPWVKKLQEAEETPPELTALLQLRTSQITVLQTELAAISAADSLKSVSDRLHNQVKEYVIPALDTSGEQLNELIRGAERIASTLRAARAAADDRIWNALDEARRSEIIAYCTRSRAELTKEILTRPPSAGLALLDKLDERYDLTQMRLGNGLQALDPPVDSANEAMPESTFRSLSDFPAALEQILDETPSEELAGILMLSDGRNNGRVSLESVARRLGLQEVPVASVVVGSSAVPRDVAIGEVTAPESIFLGDKIRVGVQVHVTGARGNSVKLTMTAADGETVLDEAKLDVYTNNYSRELRLSYEPTEHGIHSYTLRVEPLEGELFESNNSWQIDVAVSEDRTNVLLLDERPRWEFRYLRNLFYGRDKSVHLQYFLARPDMAGGVTADPLPPASAGRKFGDAEAGSLPISRDEWRKFDIIILGDMSPNTLTEAVIEDVRHCVNERGALLVVIAGPNFMPRAFDDEQLRELLPIRYEPEFGDVSRLASMDGAKLRLSPAGRTHPVMEQSASYSENQEIWDEAPEISWRFPVLDVKPGAEMLAYAEQVGVKVEAAASIDVASAIAQLDAEKKALTRNALVVAQTYGRGKVLMLNYDQTWRLRYKAGDTYHHRLWGQIMRWGLGEKLRAGDGDLRLGTDKLIYTPGKVPQVLARVTGENFVGVADAQLEVTVSRDGQEVTRVTPVYRKDSHGMYEAQLPPAAEPGRYELRLTRQGKEETVETSYVVVTATRSVELADVSATRKELALLARLTGGRAVGPAQAGELWDAFGPGSAMLEERHERSLWDHYAVLVLLLVLLTAEWLLRKRGGLT
jgi:hypothetical protein